MGRGVHDLSGLSDHGHCGHEHCGSRALPSGGCCDRELGDRELRAQHGCENCGHEHCGPRAHPSHGCCDRELSDREHHAECGHAGHGRVPSDRAGHGRVLKSWSFSCSFGSPVVVELIDF